MPTRDSSAIAVDQLVRRFGSVTAVNHLTLSIDRGQVCGLLGRNGAGKTTVVKILTTLLPPTSGSARVCGYDVLRSPTEVRRLIGYVPQALSADAELTGYENLLVMAKLYDLPAAVRARRIEEALALMGLEHAAQRLVHTYSGGMIRSLEIAQSTLHRPTVLFLDEPTVGLDPLARQTVWRHIAQLKASQSCTILLTTHYMDEAEHLCDEVAILDQGRLVAGGSPDALKHALGPNATLDEVFAHFTQGEAEVAGAYDETSRTRHVADRLG
ncbi:MAG TPA: ATP-binding cassette domain-containing protein [Steroidobacteraceae bacterium]|nr:ATP-binding cassette domain-containing protein [Steroidobacteraceae bacterium]